MDIVKIGCLGLAGVLMGLLLKQIHSPIAEMLSLLTCLLIVFFSITKLSFVFQLLDTLRSETALEQQYFKILLKIIGITYVAEFSANLCKDAGYSAVASQIELFGKISILAVSSPIIMALMETIHVLSIGR